MKWFFLSSMPPVWRYWPVYILVLMIGLGLGWTWHAYGSFAAYGVQAVPAPETRAVGPDVNAADVNGPDANAANAGAAETNEADAGGSPQDAGQAGNPSTVPLEAAPTSPSELGEIAPQPDLEPNLPPILDGPIVSIPPVDGAVEPPQTPQAPRGPAIPSTAPVLFAGVAVAALAIIANTWSQWQTSRIAHALQGLQTLRTDREYLINISAARAEIAKSSQTKVGGPIGPDLLEAMLDKDNVSASVDYPTFRDASLFVLNQYEFLAAGARSGAIDLVLVERTLAGPIKVLLTTYAPAIRRLRYDNERAFENLIWLHRIMSGSKALNFEPEAPPAPGADIAADADQSRDEA